MVIGLAVFDYFDAQRSSKLLADELEELFTERACDGFVVAATHVPGGYADFVQYVVPELQRRGLFHADYTGSTLRENLELPKPPAGGWKTRVDTQPSPPAPLPEVEGALQARSSSAVSP